MAALLIEHGDDVIGLTRSETSALPKGVQRLDGPETLPSALAEVEGVYRLAGVGRAPPVPD